MNTRLGHLPQAGSAALGWRRRQALAAMAAWLAGAANAQPERRSERLTQPLKSPLTQPSRRVVFLAQDFRNGGVAAVYRGFEEACLELGWALRFFNGAGDAATIAQQFDEAVGLGVDGLVLGGFDEAVIAGRPADAVQRVPILVGWHAAAGIGPTPRLFANVGTDPVAVADIAVGFVTQSAHPSPGVVIFNDSRFEIANAKTARMREMLAQSPKCTLLSVEDLPISRASREMPAALGRLQQRFGARWTHMLAINDVYIDAMYFPMQALGRSDVLAVAAGDGSRTALSRIRSGRSHQLATIAEPTALQGWQLADELWRAFAGQPASGRVARPIAVTTELLRQLGQRDIDAQLPFRAEYRQQWRGAAGRL